MYSDGSEEDQGSPDVVILDGAGAADLQGDGAATAPSKRVWNKEYDKARSVKAKWLCSHPHMTTWNGLFICTPCSVEANSPYSIAFKKHNVTKHAESEMHKKNALAHSGKAFTGTLDGTLPALVEELQLNAMNKKKKLLVVLTHLLLRKRPVIE